MSFYSDVLESNNEIIPSSFCSYVSDNCRAEAMLYYLYMVADGEVSYGEEKIFEEICKGLRIKEPDQQKIIDECKKLLSSKTDVYEIIVNEEIDEKASKKRFLGLKNDSRLARIVWNLVNLGYADEVYSDEERKIVHYLVEKWSVNRDVYQEFIDTADTMLALYKQKEWLKSNFQNGSFRDKKEKEIDIKVKQLMDDVKLTIEEITM